MRTILGLFALLLCASIVAALLTPPLRPNYDGPCTPLQVVEVLVSGITLSIPSAMQPDIQELEGQEKIRRELELRHYCSEQATQPFLAQHLFLKRYPDGSPFGPEMTTIYISDNPHRTEGEKALLKSGARVGPIFFGEYTIIIYTGPLKTVNGPTNLYRIIGRFYSAQVTLNLSTIDHPDPVPVLRTTEEILNKLRVLPQIYE
ncbi:hypothetical protein [Methylorubrum aminovorans]|uniref:hypothetical protein n=1 Tax=Methylorubrum aminovorans TaxID=269069 RepID=UPI001EDE34FF|nr:hypothetical protein [Methylorubrum aminovorans]